MEYKIAIIGAGVSGLSIAHCLKDRFEVRLFEKESRPGGLIKCDWVDGSLYHRVGGHVFNSRRNDVLQWFWRFLIGNRNSRKQTGMPLFRCKTGVLSAIRSKTMPI